MRSESDDFIFIPHRDSDTIVCSFTSFGGPLTPAIAFEWMGVFQTYNVHAFHCLDRKQSWYLRGVEGLSESPEGVAEHIKTYIHENRIRHVIAIGSSMGGYGSLLIGGLLGADISLAMAPQTRTGVAWSNEHGDGRWWYRFADMEQNGVFERDLVWEFEAGHAPKRSVIIVDKGEALDAMHAERLANFARIIEMPGSGHNVAHDSLKSGLVDRLLGKRSNISDRASRAPDARVGG